MPDTESEIVEEKSRLQKLSRVFGHTTTGVEVGEDLALMPTNLRPGSYEVQKENQGGVDVVDVDKFRSVRELDNYLQRFEGGEPEDLGRGVA